MVPSQLGLIWTQSIGKKHKQKVQCSFHQLKAWLLILRPEKLPVTLCKHQNKPHPHAPHLSIGIWFSPQVRDARAQRRLSAKAIREWDWIVDAPSINICPPLCSPFFHSSRSPLISGVTAPTIRATNHTLPHSSFQSFTIWEDWLSVNTDTASLSHRKCKMDILLLL